MKSKFYQTFALTLVLVLASQFSFSQSCQASFTFNYGANGLVTFSSTSILTNTATTVYYWTWGNGAPTFTGTGNAGKFPSYTYTANGTYTVNLFILSSAPTCSSGATAVITITNVNANPCNLNANFNFTQSVSGQVQFNNTSSGTLAATTYTWNFGDNSTSNLMSPAHTYSANGIYTATLYASNNATPACTSSIQIPVNVNTYCNLIASFTKTNSANGLVNFQSTSTGTLNGYVYFWTFGDGAQASSGTNPVTSHVYANGNYTATLMVMNSSVTPSCIDTAFQAVSVNNNTCGLANPTIISSPNNGVLNFSAAGQGITANTSYTWNFGNGFGSFLAAPSATYPSAGVYGVNLILSNGPLCTVTKFQTFSVTGIPCVANANFTVVPTGTNQVWTAIPSFPWNVSNAQWSWGDGSNTYSLYASHQYSASGMYPICLTVTANCGATASACASYSIYRGAGFVYINVSPPAIKYNQIISGIFNLESAFLQVYPQPNAGAFELVYAQGYAESAKVNVYALNGACIKSVDWPNTHLPLQLNWTDLNAGLYLLKISSPEGQIQKKLIIEK